MDGIAKRNDEVTKSIDLIVQQSVPTMFEAIMNPRYSSPKAVVTAELREAI